MTQSRFEGVGMQTPNKAQVRAGKFVIGLKNIRLYKNVCRSPADPGQTET